MSERRTMVESWEILRGVVGSTCHGTAIEGQDDRDEMGVFVEPAVNVCGLSSLDHYIYRDQPEGARSQPGDLDLTLYSLRKFCRLAAKGNPSVLILLWLPSYIKRTELGDSLIGIREKFISQEAGKRFLGYLVSQKAALKGERARNVIRPELVERYGYDTKFAMHALRLAYQGVEYLTDYRVTLPVPEPHLSVLRSVRAGEVSFAEAVALIEAAEAELRALVDRCSRRADLVAIDQFLVAAHRTHWMMAA